MCNSHAGDSDLDRGSEEEPEDMFPIGTQDIELVVENPDGCSCVNGAGIDFFHPCFDRVELWVAAQAV